MTPEELQAALLRGQVTIKSEKVRAMNRVILTIKANSMRVTPVRTGNLRRSIHARTEAGGDRGRVGTNVNYARWVHDGTRRMAARPFFKMGMEASKEAIDPILRQMGDNVVIDIARGA